MHVIMRFSFIYCLSMYITYKVYHMGRSAPKSLSSLSLGLERKVKCYNGYFLNGYVFHTEEYGCNIPHSGIKRQSHVNRKKHNIFFCIYMFMVFVLKSTRIWRSSSIYRKVPCYWHEFIYTSNSSHLIT